MTWIADLLRRGGCANEFWTPNHGIVEDRLGICSYTALVSSVGMSIADQSDSEVQRLTYWALVFRRLCRIL